MKFTTLIGLVGAAYALQETEEPVTDLAEPEAAEPETDLVQEQPEAAENDEQNWEDMAEEEQPETEEEPTEEALAETKDEDTEEKEPADDTLAEEEQPEEQPAEETLAEGEDEDGALAEEDAEDDEADEADEEDDDLDLAEEDDDDEEEVDEANHLDLSQVDAANGQCTAIPAQPSWTLKKRGRHSGCGNYRGRRGRMRDVGKHLTLNQCIQKCDEAGPKVCKNIEHGGRRIGYNCRLWSGTCRVGGWRQRRVDSNIYERTQKVVQTTGWTKKWGHSGCRWPHRGRHTDLGHNMSLEQCQAACDKAGKGVCNDLEFGRSYIRGACRAWSGKCGKAEWVNSDIYVRSGPAVNEIGDCPKKATECFTSSDGTKYAQYNGWDVRGGDIRGKSLRWLSRDGCANACQKTAGCRSADYNRHSKRCWLTRTPWTKYPKVRRLHYINSVWKLPPQYQKPACPKGATECFVAGGQEYAQYNGKDVRGGDIKHVSGVSREQCADMCSKINNCHSADYNPKSKHCWMTHTKWAPVPKTRNLSYINSFWAVDGEGEETCKNQDHNQCRSNSKCFWAPATNPAVEKAFKAVDSNKDGQITWWEVRKYLRGEFNDDWRKLRAARRALKNKRREQWKLDDKAVKDEKTIDKTQKRADERELAGNYFKVNRSVRRKNWREDSAIRRKFWRKQRKIRRQFNNIARRTGNRDGKINKAELTAAYAKGELK